MIPIDTQESWSKVRDKGQAYLSYAGEGGISVLQTSIFVIMVRLLMQSIDNIYIDMRNANFVWQSVPIHPNHNEICLVTHAFILIIYDNIVNV